MKENLVSQSLGLFWFVLIYALVRYLLAGPLSFQNIDMLTIVIGVWLLVWLILSMMNSESKAFSLSASLFAVSGTFFAFNFLMTGSYHDYVWYAIIAILIISLVSFIVLGITKKMATYNLLIAGGRALITSALVIVMEFWLVPLIPAP